VSRARACQHLPKFASRKNLATITVCNYCTPARRQFFILFFDIPPPHPSFTVKTAFSKVRFPTFFSSSLRPFTFPDVTTPKPGSLPDRLNVSANAILHFPSLFNLLFGLPPPGSGPPSTSLPPESRGPTGFTSEFPSVLAPPPRSQDGNRAT